jgi:glyoxylase-like metal-dependent hydrolase (beta-lactamase superfamily II)
MKTLVVSAALAAAFAASASLAQPAPQSPPPPAPAPPDFSKVVIKVTDLGHRTWELEGQGGNITVAAGDDGVIMVDGEFAPLHDKIKAAIAQLTPQPVKYLVNTHFHGDHTGGNEPFAKDGAVVTAHENVAKRLSQGSISGITGARTPPAPQGAWPTKTYTDKLTLSVKGRTAQLMHPANAHTDGDTAVWLADADVLATGDIVTLGRYPNVDVANGGNINGMIAGVDAYIQRADANTKVVPGHGPVTDKAGLVAYRAMLAGSRDAVAKLIAAGKSEDEAIAARPLADTDAKLGVQPPASANFVRQIYRSLKPPA